MALPNSVIYSWFTFTWWNVDTKTTRMREYMCYRYNYYAVCAGTLYLISKVRELYRGAWRWWSWRSIFRLSSQYWAVSISGLVHEEVAEPCRPLTLSGRRESASWSGQSNPVVSKPIPGRVYRTSEWQKAEGQVISKGVKRKTVSSLTGKPAPNRLRMTVVAASAEAATYKYASMI